MSTARSDGAWGADQATLGWPGGPATRRARGGRLPVGVPQRRAEQSELVRVRSPDDLQDLVECVEDLLEALEDMDALLQRLELVLQPLRHHLQAEVEEVEEHLVQIEALGPADLRVSLGGHQARQVDREVGLERGVFEEIRHHHLLVGVLLQLERDPHVVGRQVLDVEEGGSFRPSATSAIRSTSVDLLTVYATLVM